MANFLEILSGARLNNELSHRFQQWGIPTAWAENWGGALAPTLLPHHFSSYYAARERGLDKTDARQFATNDALRTALSAAAVYGGAVAGPAYLGGGSSAATGGASSAGYAVPSVATGAESSTAWSIPSVATGAPSAGSEAAFSVPSMSASPAGGSFMSQINYQKLLGNALKSQDHGQQAPPQSSPMQPVMSAPASVGALNPTAPGGNNNIAALLAALLQQRQ